MNRFSRLRRFLGQPPSPPRRLKSSQFPILDPTTKIEEERMPAYDRGLFFIQSNLGIFLCLDTRFLASWDLAQVQRSGFAVTSTSIALSALFNYEPLLTSLLHFQATLNPKSLPEDLLKGALQQLLLALDYLHSEAHVIHTDIQAKNIMIGSKDDSIFREWENDEENQPSPRKSDGSNIVYKSRPFRRKKGWSGFGMPLLSDFGEARLGDVHDGLIQPDIYRAPEVILGMSWTSKVDIWNVGVLVWDLFEDHHLFDGRTPNGNQSDVYLLAEMEAMLGPPPLNFLRKSPQSQKYWDSLGQWKAAIEVPHYSLEESEEYLEGENKNMFMQFIRKMLRWDPEERQSARELLSDPWLTAQY
ncbi:hypothetical protein DTO169E5_6704 [Paecilomyces variotii]|nr:hypothetical protein DTO169E5_6704 [Paecilomyces variotii]